MIYPKAFEVTVKTSLDEVGRVVSYVSVKPTPELKKVIALAGHKRFRIAKKNAKRVAELLDAEFYKDKDGKWTIDVSSNDWARSRGNLI